MSFQFILAQEGGGQLLGTVADASRAPVPRATVTIVHSARGVTRSTITDNYGSYVFAALPIGEY